MDILDTPHKYFPHAHLPTQWDAYSFHYDRRKLNLLWLVCPEADARWDGPWERTALHASIDEYYCKELVDALILPPLQFMRVWWSLRPWELELTRHWPANYSVTMWSRAHQSAARICQCTDTVVCVDFNGRKRVSP